MQSMLYRLFVTRLNTFKDFINRAVNIAVLLVIEGYDYFYFYIVTSQKEYKNTALIMWERLNFMQFLFWFY